MPNSTILKTLTLSDGTYNNTLPLEDTTARNNITSLANSLAAVATSGSYNDLTDVPSTSGTMEVVFTLETTHYECDTSIADIVDALENNMRVVSKKDDGLEIFIYEAILYYSGSNSRHVCFANVTGNRVTGFECFIEKQGGTWPAENWTFVDYYLAYESSLLNYQPLLIDGGTDQNIKTINNQSLLGSGNITIQGGGSGDVITGKTVTLGTTGAAVIQINGSDSGSVSLPSGSTSQAGILQLEDSTSSTSTTKAATSSSVKSAYDLASGAIPKSTGTTAGDIIYFSAASTPVRLAKGTAGQVLTMNSGATAPEWAAPAGGITNYNFTHEQTTSPLVDPFPVTYNANQRGSQMIATSADVAISFICNNSADNYLWVKNIHGSDDIDVTIHSVTYNNTSLSGSNIYVPDDTITISPGYVAEIGLICNVDGAFISARCDLKANS